VKARRPAAQTGGEDRGREAEKLREQGSRYYHQQQYESAAHKYKQALQVAPTGARARIYCNRAAAYFMQLMYDEAVADCAAAIAINPDFHKAYVRLGRSHLMAGEVDHARKAFQDVGYAARDDSKEHQKVREEARDGIAHVNKLDRYIKDAEQARMRHNHAAAAAACDKGLKVARGCFRLQRMKAEALVSGKRYPEATKFIRELIDEKVNCRPRFPSESKSRVAVHHLGVELSTLLGRVLRLTCNHPEAAGILKVSECAPPGSNCLFTSLFVAPVPYPKNV
jgi:tetratricopeptide (TPR) repeat protein